MLQPGTKLGVYDVVAPLGAGGMGEVYRAKDTRLGREVAIKVLPQHLSANPDVRVRFEREAKTISSLNHPNICTLFDVGREGETDFLVMELIEGETLATRLARGALPVADMLRIGAQVADAFDRAHRAGVIHRDLKPGNVMLTKSGAKLMDFGLARATDLAGPASASGVTMAALTRTNAMNSPLTAEGSLVGTFQYMAPEQLDGKDADARSDLWALGCVLYEMASGKRAYEGATQASLISAIMRDTPRPLADLMPLTPPALDRLVTALLSKDPDDRIQTAHDVKLQLDWIAEGGSRAGVPAPVALKRKGRERLAWSVAAVAGVAAVALAILALRGGHATHEIARFEIALPPEISSAGSPRISPDGRYIAFDAIDTTGTARLWLRPLSSLTVQVIPGSDGTNARPFWSPDSRFIAFMAGGKLKKVPVTGGPAQVICDAPTGFDGAWSSRGIIAFDGAATDPIMQVPAGGGTPRPLVKSDSLSVGWPEFTPDGKHLIFLRIRGGGSGDLCVLDVGSGKQRTLGVSGGRAQYSPAGYLLYTKERTLLAQRFDARSAKISGDPVPVIEGVSTGGNGLSHFSVSRAGTLVYSGAAVAEGFRLLWKDRLGRTLSEVGTAGNINNISLAPDAKRVALRIMDTQTSNRDVWVIDSVRGTSTRLTFDPGSENTPVFSPDGTWVVYNSSRGGGAVGASLFMRAANGAGSEQLLLRTPADKLVNDWSRDGRFLSVTQTDSGTAQDIVILPMTGDHTPVTFLRTPAVEGHARFSPDGTLLAYTSNESGHFEVYVQQFPGPGGKWQVSTRGGFQPTWRADGRELYYIAADGRLMAVPVTEAGGFSAGVPAPLFNTHLTVSVSTSEYQPSADGQSFLVIGQEDIRAPFALVQNWATGLAKQ